MIAFVHENTQNYGRAREKPSRVTRLWAGFCTSLSGNLGAKDIEDAQGHNEKNADAHP